MRRAVRPRPLVECVAAGGERPNFVCRDLPPETFRVGARPPWGGGERTGMNWLHFSTSEHSRREEPLVHGAQIVAVGERSSGLMQISVRGASPKASASHPPYLGQVGSAGRMGLQHLLIRACLGCRPWARWGRTLRRKSMYYKHIN